jgi:hypothetical protein
MTGQLARAAEFEAQQARAELRCPGAVQYRAEIGHLVARGETGTSMTTRWGLRNLATGEPVTEPDGRTGPATVELRAGDELVTYTMPGDHDGKPTIRLCDSDDDLFGWVRELGGGVLHIGRQWYVLAGR